MGIQNTLIYWLNKAKKVKKHAKHREEPNSSIKWENEYKL